MPEISSTIPENFSRRIRAIRYLGILGVVFCHAIQGFPYFLNGEFLFRPELGPFLTTRWFAAIHSFVLYGLFYGAVPMFFLFSGYLQFGKPRGYGETVLRRVRSLLIPMVLWWGIHLLTIFLLKRWAGISFFPKLLNAPDWRIGLLSFWGDSSQTWLRGTHCPRLTYQFWFIRDLFLLTLVSPVIGYLIREKRRGLFSLLVFGAILAAGYRPIFAGGDSLFYFTAGAFCAYWKLDFTEWVDRFWNWKTAVAVSLAAAAWMYHKYDGNPDPDTPFWVQLSSTLLLLKLSRAIADSPKCYSVASYLEGQAFFLYCSHAPTAMWCVLYAGYRLWPEFPAAAVIGDFFAMAIGTAALCTGTGILLKRFTPRLFALLTGGRTQPLSSPQK